MTSEVRDPASMVEAAQQAFADGNYAAAEQLLRDAAAQQEAELGSEHPDLATTLNNLAFVCERLEKVTEAERGYRRAHAIAVASLSPGHPLIKTSLANLLEFCAAHDIPVWTPKAKSGAGTMRAEPVEDDIDDDADDDPQDEELQEEKPPQPLVTTSESQSESEPELAHAAAAIPVPPVAVAPRAMPRTVLVATLGVAALVVLMFAIQGQGKTESDSVPLTPDTTSPTPSSPASSPTVETSPPPPPASPPIPTPAPKPPARVAPRETTPTTPARPRQDASPASRASVTVLAARVCSSLERTGSPDWHCTEVTGEGRPGRYVFYTRQRSDRATSVEHRWYVGERLHQSTTLRIPASTGNGYRTFSSSRVTVERAGDWKVELRASDGTLLDEARFVVR